LEKFAGEQGCMVFGVGLSFVAAWFAVVRVLRACG